MPLGPCWVAEMTFNWEHMQIQKSATVGKADTSKGGVVVKMNNGESGDGW